MQQHKSYHNSEKNEIICTKFQTHKLANPRGGWSHSHACCIFLIISRQPIDYNTQKSALTGLNGVNQTFGCSYST